MAVEEVPAEIVENTIFEPKVPISKLRVRYVTEPEGYARPEKPKRTAKLTSEFDPLAVGVLYLSLQDDGTYNVIDGQHRFKAALAAGEETVAAYVFLDLTNEEEAALYRKFGDYLKQSARDRFLAAKVEQQKEALAIDRLLAEIGLHVSVTGGPEKNGVNAVAALERVAQTQGPHILRESLHLLRDVFGDEMRAFNATSINGVALFLERFEKNINLKRDKLVNDMKREGLAGIQNKSNAVRAVETNKTQMGNAGAWGRAMLVIHDTGLRSRKLGPWPERIVKPEHLEMRRSNLLTKASPAAIVARRIKAAEMAMQAVRCPACRAEPGAACKKFVKASCRTHGESLVNCTVKCVTVKQGWVPMNGQVHTERFREARNAPRRNGAKV